jgi:hypothetical protein
MVTVMSLWLPIVLSAVIVFVASSIIHMMLTYHRNDFRKAANEEDLQDTLRKFSLPPGDYMLPCAGGAAGMKDPKFQEMMKKGPVVIMTVLPAGGSNMGTNLIQWFVYCLVVSVFAAYVTSRAVSAGSPYLTAFRFAGVTAFAGYALALWQNTIWYKRSAGMTLRSSFDGLVYALLTAGTFGWLWPK